MNAFWDFNPNDFYTQKRCASMPQKVMSLCTAIRNRTLVWSILCTTAKTVENWNVNLNANRLFWFCSFDSGLSLQPNCSNARIWFARRLYWSVVIHNIEYVQPVHTEINVPCQLFVEFLLKTTEAEIFWLTHFSMLSSDFYFVFSFSFGPTFHEKTANKDGSCIFKKNP